MNRDLGGISLWCVIPTHARDALLQRALDSVDAQITTFAIDMKIVVVDDVPSDATRETVRDWSRRRSTPVDYMTVNGEGMRSAGRSRNVGAEGCDADLIAFLDDDDWWEPDYLQCAVSALAERGAAMAVTWTKQVRADETTPGLEMNESLTASDVLAVNPGLTGSNFVMRATAFQQIEGFDSTLPVANDLDFLVRFLDSGANYVTVQRPLVNQVGHEHGQLTTPTERRAQGLERYLAKYEDRLTRADRRQLLRIIHSVRRVSDDTRARRATHALWQLWYSSPSQAVVSLVRLARGRRSVYHSTAKMESANG